MAAVMSPRSKVVFNAKDAWIKALQMAVTSGLEAAYFNANSARATWINACLTVEYDYGKREACVEAAVSLAKWAALKITEIEEQRPLYPTPGIRFFYARAMVALTDALAQAEMEADCDTAPRAEAAYSKFQAALVEQHQAWCAMSG